MRRIAFNQVKEAVARLAIKANTQLRPDVLGALKKAYAKERTIRAKGALENIIKNAAIARCRNLAICQDTGLPLVFVIMGEGVLVSGKGIDAAIQEGIKAGYRQGSLRNSVIRDPLRVKKQQPQFGPGLIHYERNNSRALKITLLPKGFGCENKSQLKMFLPTASQDDIRNFIVQAVKQAGPDACPPFVVGVGIGGSADYAALLAKKALLVSLAKKKNTFEQMLTVDINRLSIGPMGLGGGATVLGVRVLTHPTHIAGLPAAVNISCHALRSASVLL